MFFKDDHGIDAIQIGNGDTLISESILKGVSPQDCVAVVFAPVEPGEINREFEFAKNKLDYEIDVKLKLCFTNIKSIDVLIHELEQAKELMKNPSNKYKEAI